MYPNINYFTFNSLELESILHNQFIQNYFLSMQKQTYPKFLLYEFGYKFCTDKYNWSPVAQVVDI